MTVAFALAATLAAGTSLEGNITPRKYAISAVSANRAAAEKRRVATNRFIGLIPLNSIHQKAGLIC
jgi:hypothetical protein